MLYATFKDKRRLLEMMFNNLDTSLYLIDMESYEILFMNNYMKKLFGKDLTGEICWKTIYGDQDGPCDFCTNDKLIDAAGNPTKPYIWEIHNQNFQNRWHELHDQAIPWGDGKFVRMDIAIDVTDRKQLEQQQKEINEILEKKIREKTADLADINVALNVLLKKREADKLEIEEKIFANYERFVLPIMDQLRKGLPEKSQQELINMIELELKGILCPFSKKLSDALINLTPTDINIAGLIKFGKSNKEIAEILNSSVHTVSRHRNNIRKKTGLKNKKINLRSFLLSLCE